MMSGYGEAVGSLLYLSSSTRPDLRYVVGRLYLSEPSEERRVKHVLRYLNRTIETVCNVRLISPLCVKLCSLKVNIKLIIWPVHIICPALDSWGLDPPSLLMGDGSAALR